MGAVKNINVNGSAANENTGISAAGCAAAGFIIFTAGGVPRSNFRTFTQGTQNVPPGGMLNIADAGFPIKLGVAGAIAAGQLKDNELIDMLNYKFPTGATTDVIGIFLANGTTETDIARFGMDEYLAAVSF